MNQGRTHHLVPKDRNPKRDITSDSKPVSKGARKRLERQIIKHGVEAVQRMREDAQLTRQIRQIHDRANEIGEPGAYLIVDEARSPEARSILEGRHVKEMLNRQGPDLISDIRRRRKPR